MDKLEKYTETNETMIEDCKDIFDRLELETKQGQGGSGEPGDDPELPNAKQQEPEDGGEPGEPGEPGEGTDDAQGPELSEKELKKLEISSKYALTVGMSYELKNIQDEGNDKELTTSFNNFISNVEMIKEISQR